MQQRRRLCQRRLPAGVQNQTVSGDRADQLTRRPLGRGGGPLPFLGRTVLLGRRVDQPGQTVGEALLRECVPLQPDQHTDRSFLGLRVLLLGPGRRRTGLLQGVLEDQRLALRDGVLHGTVRVRHAPLGQGRQQGRHLQGGVPGQRGLLQEPDRDGPAAPLVVRSALGAQQRPREPVRLLRAHAGDPQQLPGVRTQLFVRTLAEGRGHLRRERLGGTALAEQPPHGTHRLRRGRRRRGDGLGGHRLRSPHRLRGGAPGSGPGLREHRGRRLLTALHGPYGREQIGGLAAQLPTALDRSLLLGLPPLDALPLGLLSPQLGLRLGHLTGIGGVRLGSRTTGRRPRLGVPRGLRLRAHSVLQS